VRGAAGGQVGKAQERRAWVGGKGARADGNHGRRKTSLVEAASLGLITVAGDGDTTVGNFLGEYTQKST
jgi:nitric oxide reductase NorQ protein